MSMHKLFACIKSRKVNNSHAREAIYSVLMESQECLSVATIMKTLQESTVRKVSLNTVYRHLTLFTECGLAVIVQDDFKKAYYTLTTTQARVFTLCPKCNNVSVLTTVIGLQDIIANMDNREFITLHRWCEKCKKR